jgi:hypothetical protein
MPAAYYICDRHFSQADLGNGIGAAQVGMASQDPRFARRAGRLIHLLTDDA